MTTKKITVVKMTSAQKRDFQEARLEDCIFFSFSYATIKEYAETQVFNVRH